MDNKKQDDDATVSIKTEESVTFEVENASDNNSNSNKDNQ
jgi:hypothetical protein